MNFLKEEEKQRFISDYKNPFKSDKVDRINIFIYKGAFSGETHFDSSVHFKNGNTEGKQNIKADNLSSLIIEIENFIKSL